MRWLAALLATFFAHAAVAADYTALVYHDIVAAQEGDRFGVPVNAFARQMAYLKSEGYTPVSLALLQRVQRGEAALPARAVLLTFDDGLRSFAERALPVLEKYRYPAVLSVVTSWADGRNVPREYEGKLMGWQQLRRVSRSPLVEIVSHSDNLHHGLRVNAFGNEAAAGVARQFDPASGSCESEEHFRARIRADLARTQQRFAAELGFRAKGIVWPFGVYDAVLAQEAARQGMTLQLSLDARPARTEDLPRIRRTLASDYRSLGAFADAVSRRRYRDARVRFVALNLDAFAAQPPARQDRLLSRMLARLELLRANGAVVDAFSADGRRSYFANDTMPVAADVLGRVLYAIGARTGARQYVYLRIPKLSVNERERDKMFAALWRNHPFGGVIFDDAAVAHDPQVVATLRYYHPDARIGVAAVDGKADFHFIELTGDKDDVSRIASGAEGDAASDWFLVARAAGADAAQLRETLKSLRETGVRNYGYGDDDYVTGRPDVLTIVGEFNGHTVGGGAR
jgi:poly-beta-1,6-N-acetyl-D-glucosamine N-deacetylase